MFTQGPDHNQCSNKELVHFQLQSQRLNNVDEKKQYLLRSKEAVEEGVSDTVPTHLFSLDRMLYLHNEHKPINPLGPNAKIALILVEKLYKGNKVCVNIGAL